MTEGAQQAMRRTMELYSSTTRFALACNASEKIIEPIQSRCAIVRFTRLSDQEVLERVMKVVEAEAVPYVPDGVEAVVFTADGDMRQALNNIQATHSGFGYVNQENVFKVCDQPHPQIIADCVAHCLANNVDDAYDRIKHLYVAGFSAMDIIGTVYRVVKNYNSEAMPEFVKLEMIREIGPRTCASGTASTRFCRWRGSAPRCARWRGRPSRASRRGDEKDDGERFGANREPRIFSRIERVCASARVMARDGEHSRRVRDGFFLIQTRRLPRTRPWRESAHSICISALLVASYVRVKFMCVLIPSNSTFAWLALRLASTILRTCSTYSGAANALASPALLLSPSFMKWRVMLARTHFLLSSRSSASACRSAHRDPRCCIWWYSASTSSGSDVAGRCAGAAPPYAPWLNPPRGRCGCACWRCCCHRALFC